MVLLFRTLVSVLFDTRALSSFVSAVLVSSLGLTTEVVSQPLRLETPLGEGLVVRRQCRGCWITLGDAEVMFNLHVLPLVNFDVSLGMDCLVAF